MAKINQSVVTGEFEFQDGTIIPYVVDCAQAYDKIVPLRIKLAKLQKKNDIKEIGETFVQLIKCTFGEDIAKALMEAYTFGDKVAAQAFVFDLTPVLLDDIFPALDRVRQNAINIRKRAKNNA